MGFALMVATNDADRSLRIVATCDRCDVLMLNPPGYYAVYGGPADDTWIQEAAFGEPARRLVLHQAKLVCGWQCRDALLVDLSQQGYRCYYTDLDLFAADVFGLANGAGPVHYFESYQVKPGDDPAKL